MFNRYFQDELHYLRELAREFSNHHPAIAPMLSGPTTDPDVERLLEGVAFQTALLRQKLDDEFPELIHELMHLVWPHYMRPVPSATILSFSPKPTLKQPVTIPAGISVSSTPVEETSCLFKTCYETEVHPLRLLEASLEHPAGKPPAIRLALELEGLPLSDWRPEKLRFYLSGDYPRATDLYLLLARHIRRIVLKPFGEGNAVFLEPKCLVPSGFSDDQALFPYPSHAFPGYRILQEYFVLPEKFLFFDLVGWDRWENRGGNQKFEIVFELSDLPLTPAIVKKDNFVLAATPAVNIFPYEAIPIRLEHKRYRYLVRPSVITPGHYRVYSIEKVIGYEQGTAREREYSPFELFAPRSESGPAYHVEWMRSPVDAAFDLYIATAYPAESAISPSETLSISLLCTNGFLPEKLHVGDIKEATITSPEFVEFRNLRQPTAYILPPLGSNLLWRLLSHLSLNFLSLAGPENLRSLLELYIFPESHNQSAIRANRKRIDGIGDIHADTSDRLVSGRIMRGQEISLKMRQDHFASEGDMFLFATVLDHFLGSYATINTFTHMILEEITRGGKYQWPARIGNHPLV